MYKPNDRRASFSKKEKKSGVKLIAMASVFHRAGGGTWRVELWGMGEGGEGIR